MLYILSENIPLVAIIVGAILVMFGGKTHSSTLIGLGFVGVVAGIFLIGFAQTGIF